MLTACFSTRHRRHGRHGTNSSNTTTTTPADASSSSSDLNPNPQEPDSSTSVPVIPWLFTREPVPNGHYINTILNAPMTRDQANKILEHVLYIRKSLQVIIPIIKKHGETALVALPARPSLQSTTLPPDSSSSSIEAAQDRIRANHISVHQNLYKLYFSSAERPCLWPKGSWGEGTIYFTNFGETLWKEEYAKGRNYFVHEAGTPRERGDTHVKYFGARRNLYEGLLRDANIMINMLAPVVANELVWKEQKTRVVSEEPEGELNEASSPLIGRPGLPRRDKYLLNEEEAQITPKLDTDTHNASPPAGNTHTTSRNSITYAEIVSHGSLPPGTPTSITTTGDAPQEEELHPSPFRGRRRSRNRGRGQNPSDKPGRDRGRGASHRRIMSS